jgi:hypothetical protein
MGNAATSSFVARIPLSAPEARTPAERLERGLELRALLAGARAGGAGTELPEDRQRWPEEALEVWQERVAIMQHLGGLPLERAERQAELRVRLLHSQAVHAPIDHTVFFDAAEAHGLSHPPESRLRPSR